MDNNEKLPKGFVYLSDIAPDIEQDVRYATNNNFTGKRVEGYEHPVIILTKEAAIALRAVQKDLKNLGLTLKVFDGYRPRRAVDAFKKWANEPDIVELKQIYYPNLKKENLFEKGYIADMSFHSRGSAVDLTIINLKDTKELNMGTIFDYFDKLSHTDNPNIPEESKKNRRLLNTYMKKHGFENLWCEWWHYTLRNEPYTKIPDEHFDFIVK